MALLALVVILIIGSGFLSVSLIEWYFPKGGKLHPPTQGFVTDAPRENTRGDSAPTSPQGAPIPSPRPHDTREFSPMGDTARGTAETDHRPTQRDIRGHSLEKLSPAAPVGSLSQSGGTGTDAPVRQGARKGLKTSEDSRADSREGKTDGMPRETGRGGKKWSDSSERDYYLHMATNYETKMDFPRAIDYYRRILEKEPDNYRIMNNIASILLRLDESEEAQTYLKRALSVENDYVPALVNMGIAAATRGRIEEARDFFSRAERLEPDNRYALLNAAIFNERLGNVNEARAYYSKLQRMGDEQGSLGLKRLTPPAGNP